MVLYPPNNAGPGAARPMPGAMVGFRIPPHPPIHLEIGPMIKHRKHLRKALLLLAVLGLSSCQDHQSVPTAPDSRMATVSGLQLPRLITINGVRLLTLAPGNTLNPTLVSKSVGRLGGVVTNGDATLIVPPLSVPNGTTISLRSVNNGTVMFRFAPNGLQFRLPALLKISTAKANLLGLDLHRLRIAGASDNADDWTIIGGVYDPLTGLVVAPVSHFSRYALCAD